jgi:hypothetical protein
MNTCFIRLFFSIICLFILFYILSFSIFEIKSNHNIFGGVFTILFTVGSIVFSNFVFWTN